MGRLLLLLLLYVDDCCFKRNKIRLDVLCFVRDDELVVLIEEQVVVEVDDWKASTGIELELVKIIDDKEIVEWDEFSINIWLSNKLFWS